MGKCLACSSDSDGLQPALALRANLQVVDSEGPARLGEVGEDGEISGAKWSIIAPAFGLAVTFDRCVATVSSRLLGSKTVKGPGSTTTGLPPRWSRPQIQAPLFVSFMGMQSDLKHLRLLIMAEENVTVRMAMMHVYGLERYSHEP